MHSCLHKASSPPGHRASGASGLQPLGQRRVGEVEVVEGIAIGDRVVTAGLQRLRPGAAVRLPSEPAPSSEDGADKVAERAG